MIYVMFIQIRSFCEPLCHVGWRGVLIVYTEFNKYLLHTHLIFCCISWFPQSPTYFVYHWRIQPFSTCPANAGYRLVSMEHDNIQTQSLPDTCDTWHFPKFGDLCLSFFSLLKPTDVSFSLPGFLLQVLEFYFHDKISSNL